MRASLHISLGAVLALVLMTGSAAAERVWTKTATSLHAEPDSKSRQVTRLQANRPLTVVGKEGRWLKVKRGAKSGWILRSQVRVQQRAGGAEPAGVARGPRQRTTRESSASGASASGAAAAGGAAAGKETASGAGASDAGSGADEDETGEGEGAERSCRKDAVWCGSDREGDALHVVVIPTRVNAYKEPGVNQASAFEATQDQELVVIGYHRPDWFYVQTLDGKFGWIPKTAVRQKGSLVDPRVESLPEMDAKSADARSRDTGSADAGRGKDGAVGTAKPERPRSRPRAEKSARGGPPRLHIDAAMGAGVAVLGRDFAANGQADYEASSTGVATHMAMDVRYRVSGAWHAGIDGTYGAFAGVSGLSYAPTSGEGMDVGGFVLHRFETSGKFGYAEKLGAFVRAGFLVETFFLSELLNQARLPRERLISPTLGLELGMADLIGELGLVLRTDLLIGGSLAQTGGLEDGEMDGMSALSSQLDASYPLSERLAIRGIYRFDLVAPSWTGNSRRAPGVNGASRSDQAHRIILGVGMGF